MRLGLVQAHLAKGGKTPLKGGKFYLKGGKKGKMFRKRRKKKDEYLLVIYKNDLSVDLNKILVPDKLNGVTEFLYVLHKDAVEEHYHIYIKFDDKVTQEEVRKVFYNSKCFISDISKDNTVLSTLYYFTDGFRLPFESNYSAKIEERRRNNGK